MQWFCAKRKYSFNPILSEPVTLLYLVCPFNLGSLSNSIIFCLNPIYEFIPLKKNPSH